MTPRVEELVNVALRAEQEFNSNRPVAGGKTWRASRLGMCLRAQYLEAVLGIKPLVGFDDLTLRRFFVGKLWGEAMGCIFDSLGILLHGGSDERELSLTDDELDIGAHVDYVIGGKIQKTTDITAAFIRTRLVEKFGDELPLIGIELKSAQSKSFWYGAKDPLGVVASYPARIQCAMYDALADRAGLNAPQGTYKGISEWGVLTVSKDDLSMAWDASNDVIKHQALKRLKLLNACRASGQLPPCECGGDGETAWQIRSCQFHPEPIENRRKRGWVATVPCCQPEVA